ncbi:MAG TPA: NAD(P)-dependent oxidoreductase [Candidatus Dormibacteraeota bacterium]
MDETPRYYPVFLDLRDRRCVVLGTGAIAAGKVAGLREAGADVVHLARPYREGDLEGARLAIDATGDPGSQAATRRAADRAGTLLNVVDVPRSCDWIAPAVLRRGALQVAVSTSGESPMLAADVRDRVARGHGEEWAEFTALLGKLRRRLRSRGVPLDVQREAHRRLMCSDVRSLLRAGQTDAAGARVRAVERSASMPTGPPQVGEVVLAGAGAGAASLRTARAGGRGGPPLRLSHDVADGDQPAPHHTAPAGVG